MTDTEDEEELPSEEVQAWLSDPVTVRVMKGLQRELERSAGMLMSVALKSADPEVRAASTHHQSLGLLRDRMATGKWS